MYVFVNSIKIPKPIGPTLSSLCIVEFKKRYILLINIICALNKKGGKVYLKLLNI